MKIGELAKTTGTDRPTLRFYEQMGLLTPPRRADNGYRSYSEQAVQQVSFIRHCRELDISLAEIQRLLELTAQPEADCDELNLILEAHLAQVRAKQAALARLEEQLLALRGRCATSRRAGECGILHDLMEAGSAPRNTPSHHDDAHSQQSNSCSNKVCRG